MDPRPTPDYETPEPTRRVGFLSKLNPRATPRSVIRKAFGNALVATAVWLVAAYFRPSIRADWHFTFAAWVGIAALVGAVCEWQVDNDSL